MSQTHVVKPGPTAPRDGAVIITKPNAFKRGWNRVKGWFSSAGRNTKLFFIKVGHGAVKVFDYTTVRARMLVIGVGTGLWAGFMWLGETLLAMGAFLIDVVWTIVTSPFRFIAHLFRTNTNTIATAEVEAKVMNREARRAAAREERAAARREARQVRRTGATVVTA